MSVSILLYLLKLHRLCAHTIKYTSDTVYVNCAKWICKLHFVHACACVHEHANAISALTSRVLVRIVFQSVTADEVNVPQEVLHSQVLVRVNLGHGGGQVHRLPNDLQVVRHLTRKVHFKNRVTVVLVKSDTGAPSSLPRQCPPACWRCWNVYRWPGAWSRPWERAWAPVACSPPARPGAAAPLWTGLWGREPPPPAAPPRTSLMEAKHRTRLHTSTRCRRIATGGTQRLSEERLPVATTSNGLSYRPGHHSVCTNEIRRTQPWSVVWSQTVSFHRHRRPKNTLLTG